MTINEETPEAHAARLRAALDDGLAEYLAAHPMASPTALGVLDLSRWLGERSPEATARHRERVRETIETVRKLTDRFAKMSGPLILDPEGEDPVTLWREWCSRDISDTDDGWAAFTNRVHAMLERRGIKP